LGLKVIKMIKPNFSLYLPYELRQKLEDVSKETYQSKSSLIRRAIIEFLQK
jgi:metal-responsive CopG/Arc/MetJ family transcriptional regulator